MRARRSKRYGTVERAHNVRPYDKGPPPPGEVSFINIIRQIARNIVQKRASWIPYRIEIMTQDGVFRMQKEEIKHIGLRVDPETYLKLRYIAKYEGRTINGQVLYLALSCIREFEKKHGEINQADLLKAGILKEDDPQ